MWRAATIFLLGGIFGTGFGVAVGFFLFPYVFPPPPAAESLRPSEETEVLGRGKFAHVNPADPIHYGQGGVSVRKSTVFLERDFKIGPGPKFHVYLVPKAEVQGPEDVESSMFVDLGQLRAFEGSQKYRIPAGVDVTAYPSVVIWCEQFGVLISPADVAYE